MDTNSIEEHKNKIIASTVSIVLFSLLLLFLLLYSFLSKNSPIAENINIEISGFGVSEKISGQISEEPSLKAKAATHPEVITPSHSKTDVEILTENFIANRGRNSEEPGLNENKGEKETINGNGIKNGTDPFTDGSNEKGRVGISLEGRKVLAQPVLSKDTKEEGKVIVEIIVDKTGKVIRANPNGRGTTTNSSTLKAKAQQAALATIFNMSDKFEEQKGTITIIFSF